jgi:hypothetical protein
MTSQGKRVPLPSTIEARPPFSPNYLSDGTTKDSLTEEGKPPPSQQNVFYGIDANLIELKQPGNSLSLLDSRPRQSYICA